MKKVLFVVAFIAVVATLLTIQHNKQPKQVLLKDVAGHVNYCEPKPAINSKIQQDRIIEGAKAMENYRGDQSDPEYQALKATYEADVRAYDTCSVRPL